jgi:S-adenosylmethionine/arginine decarboxylase-like enzyme
MNNISSAVQSAVAEPDSHQVTTPLKMDAWGQHLVLDLGGCDREAITSPDTIRAFSAALVEAIDMKAYGAPIIEHFATHSPECAGYSLVQLIETSNICAHFSDLTGDVYLDVFSCKPFSTEIALDVCEKFFRPKTVTQQTLMRTARQA